MANGKVLALYMTMSDMMRAGHRMQCEDFDCDPTGIVGSRDYDNDVAHSIVLVSKVSYDLIDEAELVIDKGLLMENIYVDIDLYHLKKGSVIEIGETLFEVKGSCEDYRYLYTFAPEVPDLIRGKRGLFLTAIEYGSIAVGSDIKVIEEA